MSEQEQQREAALDRMMTEGQQLVDQAKAVAARLDATLSEVGDKNALSDFLESDDCPKELRQAAQEDRDKFIRELEQEEQALASASRAPVSPKNLRKPRSGMNKI